VQYDSIVSELDKLGIEKNGMMIAIAAIYLREGNDDQFVRALLASHNILYNSWHNSALLPFLETQGQKGLQKQELEGAALSTDVIDNMTQVLTGLGKQNLVPLLKKHASDWNKRSFKYPSYNADMLNSISDYSKMQGEKSDSKPAGKEENNIESDITKKSLIDGINAISLLGKKFSYEKEGEPQGVIIARTPAGSLVGIVYSKTTVSDPVAENLGRKVSEEEAKSYPDWVWAEGIIKLNPQIKALTDRKYLRSRDNPSEFANEIYNPRTKLTIRMFVPFNPQKPKFDATLAAQIAASEGECSMKISSFRKEIKRLDNLTGEDRRQQVIRLAHCIRSWTTDSIKFGIIQSAISVVVGAVVSALPGGVVAGPLAAQFTDALGDAIPGFLSAGLYNAAGMKESAARQAAVTIINCLTPGIIDALGIKGWKSFFLNVATPAVMAKLSSIITEKMFGNDYGFEASDFKSFLEREQDGSIDDFVSRNTEDVQEITAAEEYLRKLYPNI